MPRYCSPRVNGAKVRAWRGSRAQTPVAASTGSSTSLACTNTAERRVQGFGHARNLSGSFRFSSTISDPTINNSTCHFAVMSTEARVVSQSIRRVQPLPDLS